MSCAKHPTPDKQIKVMGYRQGGAGCKTVPLCKIVPKLVLCLMNDYMDVFTIKRIFLPGREGIHKTHSGIRRPASYLYRVAVS